MRRKPAATAFVLGIESEGETILYAVTAAHVVRECSDAATRGLGGGSVYLRHSKHAASEGIEINLNSWKLHKTCDVAAARIPIGADGYPLDYFRLTELATDDYVRSHEVSVGDNVFFVGMFVEIPGKVQIQPVTRFGKISVLPNEPINVDVGKQLPEVTDAYLIEATSWPGFSGSPVLIYFSSGRKSAGGDEPPAVIGILHGAAKTDDPNEQTGLAIVTPAQKLIDLLSFEM
jgi:hypothetical protein